MNRLKWLTKKIAILMVFVTLSGLIYCPYKVEAAKKYVPYTAKMYSTSGTPVYANDSLNSKMVCILDRFVQVNVTGITYTGFYKVDLNGTYYIPGAFLIEKYWTEKTAKQLMLEKIDTFSTAYAELLQQQEQYITAYDLVDITGDGVPELLFNNGKEIYTFYGEHPVVIYYCEQPTTFFYNKKYNVFFGCYRMFDKDMYEVYMLDTSLLAWGQFRCCTTDASAFTKDAKQITYQYANNSTNRAALKDTLKKILEVE